MSNSNVVSRYSDDELQEFKSVIEDKLGKAQSQYMNLIEQIKDITENTSGDYTKDLTDFSSSQSEVEMLNAMATRQRNYIQELQNALIRIRNKTYGICIITGELIDKKRLIAVPTTTKSVIAKQLGEQAAMKVLAAKKAREDESEEEDGEEKAKKKVKEVRKPVIITKVIKKTSTTTKTPKATSSDDDEDDELDDILKSLDSFTDDADIVDDDLDSGDDDMEDPGFDAGFDEMDEDGED